MFEMLRGRMPMHLLSGLSGKRARALGRPGLRWMCLVALIGLVIQFALGMILNLYIMIPAADAHASWLQEIKTAPAFLTAHALVGLLLLAAGGILMLRAIALRDMVLITPTAGAERCTVDGSAEKARRPSVAEAVAAAGAVQSVFDGSAENVRRSSVAGAVATAGAG